MINNTYIQCVQSIVFHLLTLYKVIHLKCPDSLFRKNITFIITLFLLTYFYNFYRYNL